MDLATGKLDHDNNRPVGGDQRVQAIPAAKASRVAVAAQRHGTRDVFDLGIDAGAIQVVAERSRRWPQVISRPAA